MYWIVIVTTHKAEQIVSMCACVYMPGHGHSLYSIVQLVECRRKKKTSRVCVCIMYSKTQKQRKEKKSRIYPYE